VFLVKQLLTPAPNLAAVAWKQNALARGKYEYSGLTPERLKRAIDEDLAFLAAHPVRQSKRESAKAKDDIDRSHRCELMDILDGGEKERRQ
jgi:hypothetical protein